MFEDNENEVIEAEEVKEEEKKEEKVDASNNGGKKYHLIQENFKKALMWAIIGLAIQTIVVIVMTIINHVIDDNIWKLIDSILYAAGTAGVVFVGIVELKLFLNKTNPERATDLASFLISLLAFIFAFLTAFYWGIESIRCLIWFIRGL